MKYIAPWEERKYFCKYYDYEASWISSWVLGQVVKLQSVSLSQIWKFCWQGMHSVCGNLLKLPGTLIFFLQSDMKYKLWCRWICSGVNQWINWFKPEHYYAWISYKKLNKVTSVSCVVLQKLLLWQQMHNSGALRHTALWLVMHTVVLCLFSAWVHLRWAQLRGFCPYAFT